MEESISRGSKQNFSTVIFSVVLSRRFDSILSLLERSAPSSPPGRKGDEEERRREEKRREDGSLKSPVRFIYREKERRLSGDRFIEQRPVSGSASD